MTISGVLAAVGVFGPRGLPDFANDALDKACELLFDRKGKEIIEEIQSRLRAYMGAIPLNHDLEHAILLSELTAALVLMRRYRQTEEGEHFDNRGAQSSPFIGKLQQYLFGEIGLCQSLKLKSNQVIVDEISMVLDRVLPETRSTIVEQSLAEARDRVWSAILAGAGPAPPAFETLFYGRQQGEPGWSMLFLAFMRETLKNNSRAEVAFIHSRISGAREALRRVEISLSSITDNTVALRRDVSELLLLARQNNLIRRSALHDGSELVIQTATKLKYFDTKTREVIRAKFSNYCQEHQISFFQLAVRIEERLYRTSKISVKTLKSFMKGVRVDDSFIALLTSFADELKTPFIPATIPVMYADTRVEIAVNDIGETIIFHDRPFAFPLSWVEFNLDTGNLRFMSRSGVAYLDAGAFRSFTVPVSSDLAWYIKSTRKVLMVHMDHETNEPIEGGCIPMLILKTA